MLPRTLPLTNGDLHVAIILDGNGRWAIERGLPRSEGHRAGVEVVRQVIDAAPALGIGMLRLYAFSAANWSRPAAEVRELLVLLEGFLRGDVAPCLARGARLSVIGRRDRLPETLRAAIAAAETATAGARTLLVRLALDYSARESILRAARNGTGARPPSAQEFERRLAEADGGPAPAPAVDLLIRTGGEQRLSDFLLWEIAFAELVFSPTLWPDFTAAELEAAVQEFRGRERRFGGLPGRAAS